MQTKALKSGDREKLFQLRWKARTDLTWLCRNVLGYKDIVDHVHGPMMKKLQAFPLPTLATARECDQYLDNGKWMYTPYMTPYELKGHRRHIILAGRGTLKTSLNTVAHAIQWLLNFPERTGVLIFSADKKGQDTLTNEIKWHFQYNERFRELFPDYCPQKRVQDFGTAEAIILPNRDALIQRLQKRGAFKPPKEPSLMTLSIDKAGTGYHFDWIKCSDIVESTNVVTDTQREQVVHRFGLLPSLLVHPTGWITSEDTLYHHDDLHSRMIRDWVKREPGDRPWDIFIQPMIMRDTKGEPRRYDPLEMKLPWAKDEKGDYIPLWPERFPLNLLNKLRNDPVEGGMVYACTPGYAKVLMGDWSERSIKDVNVGDTIVGFGPYICPNGRQKQKLKPSKVLDKGQLKAQVFELLMASGRKIYCTEDHLWYTNSAKDKTHPSPYYPPKINRKIVKVYTPPKEVTDWEEMRLWSWLGGMIDGEGHIDTIQGTNLTLTQAHGRNEPVCQKIVSTLEKLGIPFNCYHRNVQERMKSPSTIYWLKGGRSLRVKLLQNCVLAKRDQLLEQCWVSSHKISGDKGVGDDTILDIKEIGEDTVYWLQTETGNYVSQGYASKNSQRLLDLDAVDDDFLKPLQIPMSWVKRDAFRSVPLAFRVVSIDTADTTGPKANPSCITTIAVDRAGRSYVEDIRHGKFTPNDLIDQIFTVIRQYNPQRVVIEKTGFTQGLRPSIQRYEDINHIYPNWEFRDAMRTTNKATRLINSLGPPLRSGELRFVEPLFGCDHDKIAALIEGELKGVTPQSTGSSDDVIDTIAQYFLSREWLGREGLRGGAYDPLAQDRLIHETLEPKPMAASVHQEALKELLWSPKQEPIFDPFSSTGW